MISLQFLDLSHNNLLGTVPSDSVFQHGFYIGNPGLCGNATGLSTCNRKSHNRHKRVVIAITTPGMNRKENFIFDL